MPAADDSKRKAARETIVSEAKQGRSDTLDQELTAMTGHPPRDLNSVGTKQTTYVLHQRLLAALFPASSG